MQLITGIAIPFLGTTLGAAMVFLMKNKMCQQLERVLLGVASGVMIAASVWSLLLPAIEMADERGSHSWLTVSVGFLLGIIFLLSIDYLLKGFQLEDNLLAETDCGEERNPEGGKKKISMLVFVVTLHNLPEGMAVGVSFAGAMLENSSITMAGAFALAVGIAIQNIPEGAIISMPLCSLGMGKKRAFMGGVLSGLVEPIGAVITIGLTGLILPLLPYLLSFAAGAMIYVVVEELLPDCNREKDKIAILAFALGFVIMMALDVALGA